MSDTKPDFTEAMMRLRQIAATSANNLIGEGPVNADRILLDLCAEALHLVIHAERANAARDWCFGQTKTKAEDDAIRAKNGELLAEYNAGIKSSKPMLGRIRKIKATTPAGIYAKAAIVRASKTGAQDLAMSLAQDLLDCPGLRASLRPAGEGA
jgi:hypothetical protein